MITEEARRVIVRKEDCLALGFCMSRLRPMARFHGLDFRDFIDNGIEGEYLLALNDANATELVEEALRREAN